MWCGPLKYIPAFYWWAYCPKCLTGFEHTKQATKQPYPHGVLCSVCPGTIRGVLHFKKKSK